ncbi:MAG: hypothetical protein KJ674_04230 [Nanoarchaeota archaeon]|nr:hypothetical protein [Nanoarchaeota archaeon]
MIQTINSGGVEIVINEQDGLKIGMPIESLVSHMIKHPDIASTHQGYLEEATRVLREGKPYRNGLVHKGIFVGGYVSEEIGGFIVTTVHRKFD